MYTILNKIFRSKQSKGQFLFAGVGFLLGLLMLLLSTQLYLKVNKLFDPDSKFPDFMILSKKVSTANTIFNSKVGFSKSQIKDLEAQPFIKNVGAFKANQFSAWTEGNSVIPISTELFFEAVPKKMMGEVPRGWKWKKGDKTVPVVMSQDFLNLYNFVYAPAKGLPQVSKGAVKLAPALRTKIYGDNGREYFDFKIVGFNQRIPSMIVPEEFMDYANKNIGGGKEEKPARIIAHVTNPADPALLKYLKSKKIDVNKDKLQASKAGGMVKVVMSIIGVIGVLFVLLSFVIFTMNFKVIMAEAKDEIRLLVQLGYDAKILSKYLIMNFIKFISVVSVISIVLLLICQWQVTSIIQDNGIDLGGGIEPLVILLGVLFVGISVLINVWSIKKVLNSYA